MLPSKRKALREEHFVKGEFRDFANKKTTVFRNFANSVKERILREEIFAIQLFYLQLKTCYVLKATIFIGNMMIIAK